VDAPRVAVHGGAFGSQAWRTTAQRGRRVGRASKDAAGAAAGDELAGNPCACGRAVCSDLRRATPARR